MNGKAIGALVLGAIALLTLGKKEVRAGPVFETPPPPGVPPPPRLLPAPSAPPVTPMPYKPPIPTVYVRISKLGEERVIEAKDLATYKAAGWTDVPLVPTTPTPAPMPTPIPTPVPTPVAMPMPTPMPTPTKVALVAEVPSGVQLSVRNPWGDVVTMPAEEYDPAWAELGWVILAKPPTAELLPTTPILFAVYFNRMRHPETGEEQLVPDEDEYFFEQAGWVFVERVKVS